MKVTEDQILMRNQGVNDNNGKSKNISSTVQCFRCGGLHLASKCIKKHIFCSLCNKVNHVKRVWLYIYMFKNTTNKMFKRTTNTKLKSEF